MELKIEYISKEQLKPYANNAKIHTAEQIEQIKKSIEQFGFNDPIAIWHDNEIIEGHGRLLAVMEMEDVENIPVIRLDNLSDEERRAYMLVHNKLTMNTNFDFDLLEEELSNIEIEMNGFGWSEFELDMMQRGDISPTKYEEDISEYTENEEEYLVKKRVIITYNECDKETLKEFLGIDGEDIKVIYDFEELRK